MKSLRVLLLASAALAGALLSYTALSLRRLAPIRILPAIRVPLAASLGSAAAFATLGAVWIHDLPSTANAAAPRPMPSASAATRPAMTSDMRVGRESIMSFRSMSVSETKRLRLNER